ncbi:MAG: hypothetical protein HQ582_08280, partial [Planctomycetes bacterium]|nr:hypothetical protein [Planctomycetota bacterium]
MEAKKRHKLLSHFRHLARLAKRDELDSPQADRVTAKLTEMFANSDALIREWHDLLTVGRLGPRAILGQFELIFSLLRKPRPKPPPKPPRRPKKPKAKEADEVDLSRLSNQELEEAIEDYKRRNN